MNIKKIENEKVNNAMHKAMEEESYASGYYAVYREIENMNFVIYGNNHLSKRGDERGCLGSKSFWIDRAIDLLCEDEDVFWSVLDYKEAFLIDEEQKQAFCLALTTVNQDGIIINKIYVKTFLSLQHREKVYVKPDDGVVAYNRTNGTVSDEPEYIQRWEKMIQ